MPAPVPAPLHYAAPVQGPGATPPPGVAPQPAPPVRIVFVQPPQPAPRRLERDARKLIVGVGPLVLANVHWLDQLDNNSVSVGGRTGTDERYPGFSGLDAALGVMLDVRYQHFIGVEVDLLWQNDRGTGTITVRDAGSICLIPRIPIPYVTAAYDVTIGQRAWHVPVLFKLSVPGRWHTVHDDDIDREIKKGYVTFAFGPEFVFPGDATLSVSPASGLDYPIRATASNYVMYTGALGAERRLSDSNDLRLLGSLRGSYNPSIGGSAMKRGQYDVVDGNVVPIAYRSEWRYQAAITLGLGWFF